MGTLCWIMKRNCEWYDYYRQPCYNVPGAATRSCVVLQRYRGAEVAIINKCKTTWTFITASLLQPVRKSWTIVLWKVILCDWCWGSCWCWWVHWSACLSQSGSANVYVEECCVLVEPAGKSWTSVVLVGAEPAWARQEGLDYCVVWGMVVQWLKMRQC